MNLLKTAIHKDMYTAFLIQGALLQSSLPRLALPPSGGNLQRPWKDIGGGEEPVTYNIASDDSQSLSVSPHHAC